MIKNNEIKFRHITTVKHKEKKMLSILLGLFGMTLYSTVLLCKKRDRFGWRGIQKGIINS